MYPATRSTSRTRDTLLVTLGCITALYGCADDKPAANAKSSPSEGGESVLDRAGKNIEDAHRDFQQAVKPAAEFVDEKANVAVGEAKTAAAKVTGQATADDKPKPSGHQAD